MMTTVKKLTDEFEKFSKEFKEKLEELAAKTKPKSILLKFAECTINLSEGEIYIGAITNENGKGHHIILLPGDEHAGNWTDAMRWAKDLDGDLPNRIEQAMLFANFKSEFKEEAYWSNQTHASNEDCAWSQYFTNGNQGWYLKSYNDIRARAVRRVPIE